MSTLVIQLPEHRRLRARATGEAVSDSGRRHEYVYVTSADGTEFEAQGEAAVPLLPPASQVIAVVHETDVAWHRITLPKAPASRLRAALVGVIEDALLEDADAVHLAVAPLAVAGEQAWVAAEHQLERGFTFSHWRAITSQGGQGLMLRPPNAPVLVADIAR